MTISSSTRTAGPFIGNGVTQTFPFAFKVYARSDLLVAQTVTATGVETIKILDADYTVALNSNQDTNPGGMITMLAAPPVGTTLAATSNIPLVQSLDLTNLGGFYPKVINDALDRMMINLQQLSGKIGQGLGIGMAAISERALEAIALVQEIASSAGASLIGFIQNGNGAVARTVEKKLRERVSVLDFGAKGDGVTNDVAAFIAADTYAASIGAVLCVPKPTVAYYGSGFAPTTDWICEPGTLFLNSNRAAISGTGYSFFVVEHDVTITNMIADANRINTVTGTADIPAGGWTAANYNAFTGGVAIVVQNGARPTFINCEGRNGGGLPCWHMTNSSPRLYRCKATGGRGNFGDGFFFGACTDAVAEDCWADDFTRIGFVSDTKSVGIRLTRCKATNAHDQGYSYGGTEFNASAWYEHTVGSTIEHPDFDNIIRVGGATNWIGDPRADEPLTFIGGRSSGMKLSSVAGDIFDVHVFGHKTGMMTYSMTGPDQTTTLHGVQITGGGGGPAGTPLLNGAINCDGNIENTTLRILNSCIEVAGPVDTASHGHIAFNTKLPHLTIENTKGYSSSGVETPLLIGGLAPANVTTGTLKVRNADVALWGNIYAAAVSFDGRYSVTVDQNVNMRAPLYCGPNGAIKTNVVANSNRLFLYFDVTIRGKVQNVRLRMIGESAGKSIADLRGASLEFDMNTFQPCMQFLEQNWNNINLSGAVFRNTNAAALAGNYWIDMQTPAGIVLPWLVSGTFASSSVTNIVKHGTAFEDPGFTKVAI